MVSPPSPLPDIDSQDKSNPLAATEYVQDIFAYYKRVQSRYHVAPDYMTSQADINEKARPARHAPCPGRPLTCRPRVATLAPRSPALRRCALSSSTGSSRCT